MMEWLAYNELEPIGRQGWQYSQEEVKQQKEERKPQSAEEMKQAFWHIVGKDSQGKRRP